MSGYEWGLFLHVLAAAIWVGGVVVSQIYATRARNQGPAELVATGHEIEWVGLRVFLPASIVLLLSGAYLVTEGEWGFGSTWVLIGLGVWLVSAGTGMAFMGPETARVRGLAARSGPDAPEVRERLDRIMLVARAEVVLLVVAVAAMVFKP